MEYQDVLFLMLGAVMILSMHAGFAFLEAGTVSYKNQVNAFNKILFDWSLTTVIYFLVGFPLAYGTVLYLNPDYLSNANGLELVRFFFLVGFAACIPAIISGGIVGRMNFYAQSLAGVVLAAAVYPFFESLVWGRIPFLGQEGGLTQKFFGTAFHDFAGSVVVHGTGGWIALAAILILGPRRGRYEGAFDIRPSSIPYLALGSWILIVGWFGFNVMSSQNAKEISGLVAINSLMAMTGGCIVGLLISKNDAGFTHNGALAGLIAICAGSDVVHPIAALVIGGVAAVIFVKGFSIETEKLKIDDVLGVWPLHGVCGTWGGIAAGIFGHKALGAVSDLSFGAQFAGSVIGIVYALGIGFVLYKIVDKIVGLRMTPEQEFNGSDLTFHNVEANASSDAFASSAK